MNDCNHEYLILLPQESPRLRCRRCHLTIKADDLADRFCPECYERCGKKHFDFEPVIKTDDPIARYRCETCGITVETGLAPCAAEPRLNR